MVICFNATAGAEKALDELLETGEFKDTSEAISMALTNYLVIHRAVGTGVRMVAERVASIDSAKAGSPFDRSARPCPVKALHHPPRLVCRSCSRGRRVPSTAWNFRPCLRLECAGKPISRLHVGCSAEYNKFLPAKATCRALLNLLHDKPTGISVNQASSKISHAACGLGDYLLAFDERHDLCREDAFASAFQTPMSVTAPVACVSPISSSRI